MSAFDLQASDIKISVIIPFYNRIPLVMESVQSVLAQTYTKWELLLVDDGSEDDTSELKQLARQDPRISVLTQMHAGAAAARNYGIKQAAGEFIAFLDSDDLWTEDKLERQLAFMLSGGYSVSHTSYRRMSMIGELGEVIHSASKKFAYPEIICHCEIATPTVIVKSGLLKEQNDPFPVGIGIGEDVCQWIHLAHKTDFGGLDEPITFVRVGEDTAALDIRKQIVGLHNILEYVLASPIFRNESAQIKELSETIKLLSNELSPLTKLLRYFIRMISTCKTNGFSAVLKKVFKKLSGKRSSNI